MHRLIDRTIFSLCITQPTTHLVEKTNAAGLRRINRFPLARVVDVNNYFYRITIKTDDVDYICDQEKHTSPEWIEILVRPPLSLDPDEYEPWAADRGVAYNWLNSVQSSKGSFTFYEWLNEFRPYWNKMNEAKMSVFFVAVIKKRIESLRCGDASIPGLNPVVSYLDYSGRVVNEKTMGPKIVYGQHLLLRGCVHIPHKPVSEDRTYVPAPLPKDGGCTVKRVRICKENVSESVEEDDFYESDTESTGFEPVSTGEASAREVGTFLSFPEIPRVRVSKSPEPSQVPVVEPKRFAGDPPPRRPSRFYAATDDKQSAKDFLPMIAPQEKKSDAFQDVKDEEWGDEEKTWSVSASASAKDEGSVNAVSSSNGQKVLDYTGSGARQKQNYQGDEINLSPEISFRRSFDDPIAQELIVAWEFIQKNITFNDEYTERNKKIDRLLSLKSTLVFFGNEDEFSDVLLIIDGLQSLKEDNYEPSDSVDYLFNALPDDLGFVLTRLIFSKYILALVDGIYAYFQSRKIIDENGGIEIDEVLYSTDIDSTLSQLYSGSFRFTLDKKTMQIISTLNSDKMIKKDNILSLFENIKDQITDELQAQNDFIFTNEIVYSKLWAFMKFYKKHADFFRKWFLSTWGNKIRQFQKNVFERIVDPKEMEEDDFVLVFDIIKYYAISTKILDDVDKDSINIINIWENRKIVDTIKDRKENLSKLNRLEHLLSLYVSDYALKKNYDGKISKNELENIFKPKQKEVDELLINFYRYVPYFFIKSRRENFYQEYYSYKEAVHNLEIMI